METTASINAQLPTSNITPLRVKPNTTGEVFPRMRSRTRPPQALPSVGSLTHDCTKPENDESYWESALMNILNYLKQ
ncbi:hypothetical protein [Nostoc sp.]|uniref:hypothetical protein n=1 Tax=Nostoc sp. TaxID=1180 RepID=UPI002FFD0C0B